MTETKIHHKNEMKKSMKMNKFGNDRTKRHQEKIFHEYHKLLRKEQNKLKQHNATIKRIYEEELSSNESTADGDQSRDRSKKKSRISALHKAKLEWKKKEEEKQRQIEEREKRRKQMEKAMAQYEKKKKLQYKKLCVRNYKGQPNMASQMEVLLNQIEKQKTS